jgi:hypothetical protein
VELLDMAANDRNNGVIRQYQSVLMHYSELQSRSAGVEEIYMKFEQKVADEVAKAGFRQKPGPKKGSIQKRVPKISRRGKTNHSDWNLHKNIPRRKVQIQWRHRGSSRKTTKTIYQRQWQWSYKSQATSAIRSVIAHS